MPDTSLLENYLSAPGLTAKLAVIGEHEGVLLTEESEQEIARRAKADPEAVFAPDIEISLLQMCREHGVARGGDAFANALINAWLSQDDLGAKGALMLHWADPVVSETVQTGVEKAASGAEEASDAPQAILLRWHARLIERVRVCVDESGIVDPKELEAALQTHAAEDGATPAGAGDQAGPVDPEALWNEYRGLQGQGDAASIQRRIEILETRLAGLPEEGDDNLQLIRAGLMASQASDLDDALQLGMIRPDLILTVQDRADGLYRNALEVERRLKREVEAAGTAQNWANLLAARYEGGDVAAGDKADGLYDYALEIQQRLKREVEAATTAQNWAILLAAWYEGGDAEAGDKADGLYASALEIQQRLKREVEAARTAQNWANLLQARYEGGDAEAGDKADGLYDSALEIRQRLKREVEAAGTAQNWANLLVARYKGGDVAAGDKADGLYDYALEIQRRLKREVEAARIAQNWANLLQARYEGGDVAAGDKADGLYASALEIRQRLKREVEAAGTAQNWAILLAARYEGGDVAAGDKADGLYASALEIRQRLKREVEAAGTAQNWANLLVARYKGGDAEAGDKADGLYDYALEIQRRLKREVEAAGTAQNWAILLQARYKGGDAEAGDKADGLYDYALEIRQRRKREVEAARTAQNWASLLTARYEGGDVAAGDKADGLYDYALEIQRHLKREVEAAGTAQNWAILLQARYKGGDAEAGDKADGLYDYALEIRQRRKREVEAARTAQNWASLLTARYKGGDAASAGRAHALYEQALETLPAGASFMDRVLMHKNRFGLLEMEERWPDVATRAQELLRLVQARLPEITDRASRDNLLTLVAGVGRRGAWAALRAAGEEETGAGSDPVALATILLESGRAQQLGARLREAEAVLSQSDRAVLDAARADLSAAEHAAQKTEGRDPNVVAQQATAHKALQALLSEFGLSYVDVTAPPPGELHAALSGAPQGGAIVQTIAGNEGGALLILTVLPGSEAGEAAWQLVDVPGLTQRAVDHLLGRHVDGLQSFEQALSAVAGEGDALPQASHHNLAALCDFSGAIDQHLHPAVHGLPPEGSDDAPSAWGLLMGPLTAALEAAGLTSDPGAHDVPEVVLCLPADLGSIPLEAARDPDGHPFLKRYACSRTPSLNALIAATTRAARATQTPDASAIVITDPVGDLGISYDVTAHLPLSDTQHLRSASWLKTDRIDPAAIPDETRGPGAERLASLPNLALAARNSTPKWLIYFGHSHHDIRDGEGSALILAEQHDPEGEYGTPHVLAGPPALRDLPLVGTRMVFSASCGGAGLGLGKARDEMGGLPAAWLEAGAAAIISSLHPVLVGPAQEALHFTLSEMLATGARPAQALRRAQITMATPRPVTSDTQADDTIQVSPLKGADMFDAADQANARPPSNQQHNPTTAKNFAFVVYGA